MLAPICISGSLSVVALKREAPVAVPAIAMNVVLVAVFIWLNFQAPWFYQDTWADR